MGYNSTNGLWSRFGWRNSRMCWMFLLTSSEFVLGCPRHVLQVSRTLVTRSGFRIKQVHGSKTQLADLPWEGHEIQLTKAFTETGEIGYIRGNRHCFNNIVVTSPRWKPSCFKMTENWAEAIDNIWSTWLPDGCTFEEQSISWSS